MMFEKMITRFNFCWDGAGMHMSAVCCAGTWLSAGSMLFGHWFPPHALCSVLSFSEAQRRRGETSHYYTVHTL